MGPEEEPRNVQYPLDPNKYVLVDEIGHGVSSVVYKAICTAVDSPATAVVAIKCIHLDPSRTDLDRFRCKDRTWYLRSHPNLLWAHCSFPVGHRLWVVMPFMSGGSLRSIMSWSFPNGFSEPCIAVILRETLSALANLHELGQIHRNIKPGNILMGSNGAVKLADFGISASVYEATAGAMVAKLAPVVGMPYWIAPEMVPSQVGYSFKADMWSFGITALELAHGRPPLSHLSSSKSLMMEITKRFRFWDHYENTRNSKRKQFSQLLNDMVGLCLDRDPSKRPSARQLLKHPFFRNYNGPEFLVKNILEGLPRVEQRYKAKAQPQRFGSTSKSSEEDAGDEDEEFPDSDCLKQRRDLVSSSTKKLDPAQLADMVMQVRFGRGTIIQKNKVSLKPSSLEKAVEGGQRKVEPSRQDGGTERSPILESIMALKKSIDVQSRNIANMVALFTKEEGQAERVKRLKMELENVKIRNFQLEEELNFLISRLSATYTHLDFH